MGLRGQLSNPSTARAVERLARLLDDVLAGTSCKAPGPSEARPPYRLRDRLSAETVSELVTAYEAGKTADELAQAYKIGKVGILKYLHQHRVVRKRPPTCLTSERVAEAAALYDTGLSAAAVGSRLGIASSTLLRGFQAHGVQRRSRGGRHATT